MSTLCKVISKLGFLAVFVMVCLSCQEEDDYNYIPDITSVRLRTLTNS